MTLDPVRFSRLKQMARSPLHYRTAPPMFGASLERGTAVHSLLLGGDPVIFYPGATRRGKEWDAFKAAHEGYEILSKGDYDKAHRMADAVNAHADAMHYLKGSHEVEVEWSFLGRACGSRIDVIGWDYVTELKTSATADPNRFQWQALRLQYHAQLAFYQDACEATSYGPKPDAFIVIVESTPPFPVTVMQVTPRALEAGRRNCRMWFERLLGCEEANSWPGYCESIVPLDVPEEEPELVFADADEEEPEAAE